jgi:hypothetical protein
VSLTHLVSHHIAVQVHRRPDVRVTHQTIDLNSLVGDMGDVLCGLLGEEIKLRERKGHK